MTGSGDRMSSSQDTVSRNSGQMITHSNKIWCIEQDMDRNVHDSEIWPHRLVITRIILL